MSSLLDFLKKKFFFNSCRRWQGQKREKGRKGVDSEARPLMKRKAGGCAEQGQRRRRIEGAGGTSSFMMLTGYKKQPGC